MLTIGLFIVISCIVSGLVATFATVGFALGWTFRGDAKEKPIVYQVNREDDAKELTGNALDDLAKWLPEPPEPDA